MDKTIEIMADEALKVLARVYGTDEATIMAAAVHGNAKVLADLRKLVGAAVALIA